MLDVQRDERRAQAILGVNVFSVNFITPFELIPDFSDELKLFKIIFAQWKIYFTRV